MPRDKTTVKTPTTTPPATLTYQRTDNFISSYANNAYFESSAWDLKIVFGQLDQPVGSPAVIRQHISITVLRAQAKLALYYLRLHIEANELQNGKILIREDLLPPEPTPPAADQGTDPTTKKLYDTVRKLPTEFIASL